MGKKRKIQNDVDKEVVKIGNQKKDILISKSPSNEIEYNVKRIKQSKKEISTDNESNKTSIKHKKKSKHQKLIPGGNGLQEESNDDCKKNKKKKKKQNETNDIKLQQEGDNDKALKKRKFDAVSEFEADEAHSSKELIVAKNKKSKSSTGPEEVNKDNELNEQTSKTNKIGKKKKPNVKNEEIQTSDTNNVNKEKPKKKKKRKILEPETVDDDEIDKYCDELDDFHNKQYENWVKLIEQNLNKNVKK